MKGDFTLNVKLQIYFKATDGKSYKRVISYANPAASDEVLENFVAALNNLTTNDLKSVMKVVNTYLDDEFASDEISEADINAILNGTYINVADEGGITQVEINTIFDETYTPAEDEGGISQSNIDNILASWD